MEIHLINVSDCKLEGIEEFVDCESLSSSIDRVELLQPIVVRPIKNAYEVIVGVKRVLAFKQLERDKIPAVIKDISEEQAILCKVESNFQDFKQVRRINSVMAETIASYYNVLKKQGRRTDLVESVIQLKDFTTYSPVGKRMKSDEIVGKRFQISARTVARCLRVSSLQESVKQIFDKGQISLRVAVEISFLSEEVQKEIAEYINEDSERVVSLSKVAEIRNREKICSKCEIENILSGTCEKLKLQDILKKYPLASFSKYQKLRVIDKALENYFNQGYGKISM